MTSRPPPDLAAIAREAMIERGLRPEFPDDVLRQARGVAPKAARAAHDLRALPWASIDNDESRDLDQLTVAEPHADGSTRILVAIADVASAVPPGSPLDVHAAHNTTSVYTAARIFPMLPERLSTDLTSLNPAEDRLAVVVAYVVLADGAVEGVEVFPALVHNHAKLAYDSTAEWLEGTGPAPPALDRHPALAEQIRLQDRIARSLADRRREEGALDVASTEARPILRDGVVVELRAVLKNRARTLIESFMVAANGAAAAFLQARSSPVLRRVVRSPERWDRLVALAEAVGDRLPPEPDSRALSAFLARRREADPLHFPDLSLAVVKLVGGGQYVVEPPGAEPAGHFGLAMRDYAHSTAPNRRYPDLLTQRLLLAAAAGAPAPYATEELAALATHCTRQEDAASKVERHVRKSAAAMLLSSRIGERFEGIVTGASKKGTWARLLALPVEGKVEDPRGADVGDRVALRLSAVDVDRGHVDFERVP